MTKPTPIVILGSGGMAREVAWLVEEINAVDYRWEILGFSENNPGRVGQDVGRYSICCHDDQLQEMDVAVAMGIGNPEVLVRLCENFGDRPPELLPNLIHPSVILDPGRIRLGNGNIICAGSIFTIDIEIGSCNVFNIGCRVSHDVSIADGCVVNPRASLAGGVRVGAGVLVGAGATVLQYLEVGTAATVGAGAVVTKSVPDGVTVWCSGEAEGSDEAMKRTLDQVKLRPGATIRNAMVAIQEGSIEIALMVDRENHMIGTVTDGDIRRALLADAHLDDTVEPFVQQDFTSVGPDAGRAEVLDLMRARVLRHIPVVDEEGLLVGLHLLRELVGGKERGNWAIIMAGGRGTRLRPITDTIPKPMVPVAGRPILERIVLHLVGFGFRKVFISLHYRGEMIEQHFGDGSAFGCEIQYLKEVAPLGTGGALSLLPSVPKKPVLVMNGDLLTEADLGAMLDFHERNKAVVTVGLREYTHTIPYGVASVKDQRLTGLEEKPTESWWANSGLYVLEPEIIERIPHETMFHLTEAVEDCLKRDEAVGAFQIKEDWMDIGRRIDLRKARGEDVEP